MSFCIVNNNWLGSRIAGFLGIGILLAHAGELSAQTGFGGLDARSRDGTLSNNSGNSFGWNYGGGQPNYNSPQVAAPNVPRQNFTLGVAVNNTERGCVVTQVQQGSPAARVGIETGDTIVTVGGYQVGYVDNRLFDVGDEISRRGSAQGRASLVVQDHRTGQLELLNVDLQSTSIVINGEAIYRERQLPPNNSYLQVRVENITRPYAAVNGGTQTFPFAGAQTQFQLSLDPQYLYAGDRFQVQAQVVSGNQAVLVTPQPVPIDVTGNQPMVRLELVSLNSTAGNSYSAAYGNSTQSIIEYYRKFLRRDPTQREMIAWEDHVNRGRSVNDLPTLLISSPEFYESSGGTSGRFIDQMFRIAAGRAANQAELNQWAQELQNTRGDRAELARRFYAALGIR